MAVRSELRKADRVLDALGDPTRRAMINGIYTQPKTVSELARSLNITRTAVGQHLNVLEACGLVRTEKIGRVRHCAFNAKGLEALETWIDQHRSMWSRGLDRLGALLDGEDDA